MSLANYLNALGHALRLFHKRTSSPIYLILFVTERCNARCRHCFVAGGTEGGELSVDELRRISATMGRLLVLLPTGGEPFLRSDLPEIVHAFYHNNGLRNAGIPTNGSLGDDTERAVRRILSLCPRLRLGVDVSLDALGSAHDEIRRHPGLFEKAVATYWRLKKLEHNPRFRVCVEITVSKFNQDSLLETYDYFIRELRVHNVFVRLVRGSPRDPAARDVDLNKYEALVRRIEDDLRHGVLQGHAVYPLAGFITARDIIGRKLTLRSLREGRSRLACTAGRLTGVIRANGDVHACELLDRKLGNLRDTGCDFPKVWLSPEAARARKAIRDTRCFCTHECFQTANLLFSPRMLPAVLREYARLKLRRDWGALP